MSSQLPQMRRVCLVALVTCSLLGVSPVPSSFAADPSKLQKELDSVAAQYGQLETQLADTEARRRKLEIDLKQADKVIGERSALMKVRASYIYKQGGVSSYLSDLIMAPDIGAFFKRLYYIETLGKGDTELIDGLRVTQSRADLIFEQLAQTRAKQAKLVERQKEKKLQLEAKLKGAKSAAKVSRVRRFDSFTLPVSSSAFANTWGARRSGGRRHKGTDVMASCGASVLAVTDGVISNLHAGGNGGIMAYLRAGNGDVFFYAHLRGYAPGIHSGSRVTVGQKIAVNGNTGNARGGPCHVHFEWHRGGGAAVNPYPLLAAAR